ncbi:hypothetical protein VNO77_40358 [Canavalia gladiata]|uniref:Uncharacterized protein n=1 Tax=Canavalia gladiata TaxID=3824 RepID=A0AAN9K017_CANGL
MQMDTLLEIVINNLNTFARDKLAMYLGVDKQTQKLTGYLNAINAVLQDAEEKRITSHAVKDWLQKLRDAAHVLDDILDECSIHFAGQNSESGSACLTRFHPQDILFRYDIGKRMKDITQRFYDIDEERRMFEFRSTGMVEKQRQPQDEWRQTTSIITEPKVYGREHDKKQIVEFLLTLAINSEELSIYPIIGMGGLGKTTLAQLVFNDDQVGQHFALKIWVCVSEDFSISKILLSIIESTTRKNPSLLTSLESKQKEVQLVLRGKRYLLVLDDVWNEDHVKWEELKSLLQCGSGTKGASILVTTRHENVASMMGTVGSVHRLLPLSMDDNWSLFQHHAFREDEEEHTELISIGKEIVKKCTGLPLASKTLGSLLRFKRGKNQWLHVKEYLPEDNIIMDALRLSYLNLSLPLRRCFAFCAIFPKDARIMKEDLIYLWIANAFILSKGSLEVEDVGNEVWNDLYQRSFFQEVKVDEVGQIISFKMHDLFHDLAESIMGEECVVSEPARLTNLSSRVHHISCKHPNLDFGGIKKFKLNMGAFKKCESLRTFLDLDYDLAVVNVGGLPSVSSLRALSTKSSQLSALKNLTHLRYLSIYNSAITTLPKSICRLKKLQILEMRNCLRLSSLPKQLTQLHDLRHIVIEGCDSLVAMPPKIGTLKCLITLSTFIVDSKVGFGLAELHDLHLGGKLHIKGLQTVPSEWDAKQANMIDKKDLKDLYLTWGSTRTGTSSNVNSHETNVEPERVLEALQPHSGLRRFRMTNYPGIQLANWMRNTSILKGLVHVVFINCKNCERLPPLGKLPHLQSLSAFGMEAVKYVDDSSYDGVEEKAFPSLENLMLKNLPNLERMLRDERVEMLPRLSKLSIYGIPSLKLPCLPSVEKLEVDDLEDMEGVGVVVLGNMPCLKTLSIAGLKRHKVLPNGLGRLGALQTLFIVGCYELESFTKHALQGLTSLRSLFIYKCEKLKSLSEGMGHLVSLEDLGIYHCPKLMALPSSMNQLTALRELSIGNKILPEGLQHIPSLQRLVIEGCTSLPDWLGDMTSLRSLGISKCTELRSLPSSFQHLTNLNELYISKCPMLEKRCQRETGEDWQYIAHIPQVQLLTTQDSTPKFHGKFTNLSNWP